MIEVKLITVNGDIQIGTAQIDESIFCNLPVNSGYDVFVLGGQSNGYFGYPVEAQDVYPSNCFQLGNIAPNVGLIVPAQEPLDQYNTRMVDHASPMRTFIDSYISNGHLANGRQILIVSGCLNGTGFDDNRWNKGNDLYQSLLTRVQSVLSLQGSELKAICMHMGERDCEGTPSQWEQRFKQFTLDFKYDLGQPYSNVPVILGGMPPAWVDSTQYRIDVNNKCTQVASYVEFSGYADPRTPTVLTDIQSDGIHYGITATREIGLRYYTAYTQALLNSWNRSVANQITDLTAFNLPDFDISLTWSAPANTYPYIENYKVYVRLTGATTWTHYADTVNTTIDITGLSHNTSYDFAVSTVNFEGESLISNIETKVTSGSISYTHSFMYLFEQNLDNGVGGTGTGFGAVNYFNDPEKGWCLDSTATNGVLTGVNIDSNTSWSKAVWVKYSSTTLGHIMSSFNSAGSSLMAQGGKVRVGSLASMYQISQSDGLVVNVWAHVIVTYDHTTDTANLYINGVNKGTATIADLASHQICIGNKNGSATGFIGYLKDARLYPYVLDESQRQAVFTGTII